MTIAQGPAVWGAWNNLGVVGGLVVGDCGRIDHRVDIAVGITGVQGLGHRVDQGGVGNRLDVAVRVTGDHRGVGHRIDITVESIVALPVVVAVVAIVAVVVVKGRATSLAY